MGLSRSAASRRGLTIYEVFLALALLMGALAVLSQHIAVGTRAGVGGQLQTKAAMLCQTKMAEVVGGIEPLSPVSGAELPDAGLGWTWTLEVASGPSPDLLSVAVTVLHSNGQENTNASFTLRRLMRDPQVLLDLQEAPDLATGGAP